MPVEPTYLPDEALRRDLEAFGKTLQAETEGGIFSPGITDVEVLAGFDSAGSSSGEVGEGVRAERRWARWALVAAAVALIAVGAAALVARRQPSSTLDPAVDDPATTTSDGADDRSSETETEAAIIDTFTPVGPLSVVDIDGNPIGGVQTDPGDEEVTLSVIGDNGESHRPYVEMALGEVLADRDLLTELGWRSDLIEEQSGRPMTAQRWLAQSGLTIITNLDPDLSGLAADAIADHLDPATGFDATVITIDPSTGGVAVFETTAKTVYWESTLPESNPGGAISESSPLRDDAGPCCRFQPGSAFKPIVLAAAFEDGASPEDLVRADGPCDFEVEPGGTYRVGGSDREAMSLAAATRASNNCAYVRLGLDVGTDATLATAARLGLTDLPDTEGGTWASLPLGTWPVDPVELTGAYAAIANDGRLRSPRFVAEIIDTDGTVVHQSPESEPSIQRAISTDTARRLTEVLTSVVDDGTGRNARLDGHQVAGKTGTTNDFIDAWFIGYTTSWATTVWMGDYEAAVGIEEPRALVLEGYGTVFGGELPAMIWHDYMQPAHDGIEPVDFPEPPPVERETRLIEVEQDRTGDR